MSRAVALFGTQDRESTQMFVAVREDGEVFGRIFNRFATSIPEWTPAKAVLNGNTVTVVDFGYTLNFELDPIVLNRLNHIPMGAITLPE